MIAKTPNATHIPAIAPVDSRSLFDFVIGSVADEAMGVVARDVEAAVELDEVEVRVPMSSKSPCFHLIWIGYANAYKKTLLLVAERNFWSMIPSYTEIIG